jgi:hypothetical protein
MKFLLIVFFLLAPLPTYAASSPATISTIQTISEMGALAAASPLYTVLQVLGYNTASDGGGGTFILTKSSATADGCVTFPVVGDSTRRWIRQLNGQDLTSLDCGAFNNNTNAAATQVALQAGVAYIQKSDSPNSGFHIIGGTYACGSGAFCIQTNERNWCPRIYGDGPGNTIINYTPTSEHAAFLFNSGIGQCNGGGVSNLRVAGNSNTIGCEALSTNNGHCSIQADDVKALMLWCSCSKGGFSENFTATALQGSGSWTRLGEYRTNNGGSGSFRDSGFGPGTILPPDPTNEALILINRGSMVYSAPLYVSINYQPGISGRTLYFIDNQSSNFATFYGDWQVEVDGASNPAVLKLVKAGAVGFGGSIQKNITGTGQLVYGALLFGTEVGTSDGRNSFKNSYFVLENAASSVQYLTAGTGATTTVAAQFPTSGETTYKIQIYNGTTYNWAGNVTIVSSGIGAFAVTDPAGNGHRFSGSNDPVFGATKSGALTIRIPDTVAPHSTRIFGVVYMPGETN